MKHKIIALVAMAFCAAGARAQGIEIRDVFRQMPDTVVPYLSQNNRLDLVDFVDSGMKAEVENRLGGNTVLEVLGTDYLKARLTPSTRLEMKLLPCEGGAVPDSLDRVVCVVMTYGDSIRQSSVRFFSTGWAPLSLPDPVAPQNVARYKFGGAALAGDFLADLPHTFIEAVLAEGDCGLTVNLVRCVYNDGEPITTEKMSTTLKWAGDTFK